MIARRAPDVLVIGGGVVGCAVADALAATGRTVLVVDRGALGAEASSAAAGVLAAASGSEPAGPRLALRRASLELFPALAARLRDETGVDPGWTRSGVLELLLDPAGVADAEARAARRRAEGFRVERLDAPALRAEAPAANPAAAGALLFPDDAQVVAPRLVEALAASARRRGAELVAGAEVRDVAWDGARIARVHVNADTVTPGTVVLAAGAWSPGVPGLVPRLGVVPARGQMVALRPAAPAGPRILTWADGYLVPRADGEVLVGATVEDAGFAKAVTSAGLAALAGKVAAIAPALAAAPVVRAWAGLRPHAPAGGPILGRVPETENLVVATGHHRNGVLLAPITAAVVAAVVAGAPPPVDVAPFLPPRAARA
ncbi:MAG TPA: glycine oxidase ThiO [Candidatus Binatia bacterium]|nr:glycine oxidase ThiO [Candidatus Binatia bacterium]